MRVTSRSRPTGRMPSSLRCSKLRPGPTAAQGAPMVCRRARRARDAADAAGAPRRRSIAARLRRRARTSLRATSSAGGCWRPSSPRGPRRGAERAEALVLLAETEDMPLAVPLLKQALQEPGAPAALRASIHQRLSLDVRFLEGLDAAEEHALAAVELAEQVGDAALRASALGGLALIQLQRGQARGARARRAGLRARPRRRGVAGRSRTRRSRSRTSSSGLADFDRARALLESLHADWSERDERMAAYALWYLAMVELRTRELRAGGAVRASSARQLSGLYVRDEVASPTSLFPLTLDRRPPRRPRARSRARRGDLPAGGAPRGAPARAADDARDRRALERVAGRSRRLLQVGGGDDGRGRRRRADDAAVAGGAGRGAARARPRRRGGRPAGRVGGRRAAARSRAGRWRTPRAAAASSRQRGGTSRRRWPCLRKRSSSTRRRAIRSAGRGRSSRSASPGGARGRNGRPGTRSSWRGRASRSSGPRAGPQRARGELGAIGGRTRSEGLTPAERRVADLVADGRTNAEVAATLFLAERTVASHLTHVYAKLGVRSRTELARKLADGTRNVPAI